jgi:hypothetical protein
MLSCLRLQYKFLLSGQQRPPNIVVEWLTLLVPMWEVPGLNLGPNTSYSEIFVFFFSVSR